MAWPSEEERRENSEEGDEELDDNDFKAQKDAVLFAIDVSKSMLEPPPASDSKKADKDSAVSAALKCAYQVMQQRIIAQPKDMIGILLFGTEKSKFRDEEGGRSGSGYPHCYLFTDLDVPGAEDVRALKDLVEEDEDPDGILTPSSESVSMANVLFCANQIFTTNAANFGSRRLFIVTDNDDPHAADKGAKSSAAVRAKDLFDLGVVIELFPITREESKFDLSKFYDDIVYRDPATEAGLRDEIQTSKSGDGLSLLNSLVSNVNSKQVAKRSLFSNLPFEIAPGLKITVKGYNILHRQKEARSCYVWLDGEKPELAVGETTLVEETTARTVEKVEKKKAYKFGGEYVYFTPEEQATLKDFGSPVLRIIGFKPRSLLPLWAAVKKSNFIFPSEEDYVGSTRVFSALWQKLLKSKKMGIAWFIARRNARPIMVAIIPSKTPSDETSGTPYLPAGLWLYPLPFADDVRAGPEFHQARDCKPDLIDKMRKVVQQLQLPKGLFTPAKYPNPQLQWHYQVLQALALEEELPEKETDATLPRFKQIHKRAGGYMADWQDQLAQDASKLSFTRAVKREIDEDDGGRPSKKAKAAPKAAANDGIAGSMSTATLKKAVEDGTLSKMKVADLKEVLAGRELSTAGKKADLLERLELWVEEN